MAILPAKKFDAMIELADDAQSFQAYQFQLAAAFAHEVGGHGSYHFPWKEQEGYTARAYCPWLRAV
jgi:hypothetical protein